ncbi:MAG: PEGA domain-containing protein [Deltaproteobacteria bacterium]|nr:PEGA domain-containing protein [Deltaproteobacteria bacterium]
MQKGALTIVVYLLFVLLLLIPRVCDAKPRWASWPPNEDTLYKYYVGRSGNAESEAAAFNEAIRDAANQAIRENFGVTTSVESDSYEQESITRFTKRIREKTSTARLEGFEKVDSDTDERDGKITVWALFRYSKAAIQAEKKRLDALGDQPTATIFSEAGPTDAAKGVLEIKTTPSGAEISVDGKSLAFLKTPLRYSGEISTGEHLLQIEHPQYVTETQRFIMVPGTTVRINKILKPAYATLDVSSTPSGATVLIDGITKGKTPVAVKIPASTRVKLELEHELTERVSEEVIVAKDSTKSITRTLPRKPGVITILSKPSKVNFELSGPGFRKKGKTPTGPITLPLGEYMLTLRAAGYSILETRFSIESNLETVLPVYTLSKLSYLSVKTSPKRASITVSAVSGNAKVQGTTPLRRIALSAGTYDIVIEKDGYQKYEDRITLAQAEHSELSAIELKRELSYLEQSWEPRYESKPNLGISSTAPELDLFGNFPGPSFIIAFGTSVTMSPIQSLSSLVSFGVSLSFQLRTRCVGIEFEGIYGVSSSFTSKTGRFALPVYLAPSSGFFISPEIHWVTTDIKYYDQSKWLWDKKEATVSQTGVGLGLGWMIYTNSLNVLLRGGIIGFGDSASRVKGQTAYYFTVGFYDGW